MTTGWYVVIVGVAIVVVGLLYLRHQRQRSEGRRASRPDQAAPPDFTRDREAARLTHMSADDRAWETASLQRQQANQDRAESGGDPSRRTGA
jgi:hypothetical protein